MPTPQPTRDILNRDLVTLTNCELEPIHIPGAIQPHGFLLAMGSAGAGRVIRYCSANTADYVGYRPEVLLGAGFAQAFGEEAGNALEAYLLADDFEVGTPTILTLSGTPFHCTVHQSGPWLLLEGEHLPDGQMPLPDLYRYTRRFFRHLEDAPSLQALCGLVANEIRNITGYDRVMVYRFDQSWNGEVIAEAVREDLEPFLHLHYPHTDIPAQARLLYQTNLIRMIADVGYGPVPILTPDDGAPADHRSLDLSQSLLRSVSPIHVEYLLNMGVGATLTISLLRHGQLWGLIACHHYSPHRIPYYTRLSALLQGHFLSSQIGVREAAEAFAQSQDISAGLDALLARTTTALEERDIATLMAMPQLLDITGATGAVLRFDGKFYTQGRVPDEAGLKALTELLRPRRDNILYATSAAAADLGDGAARLAGEAAGMLYQSLLADGEAYILWLRGEHIRDVLWAGDPTRAIVHNDKGLSPRKSFEQWKEEVTGKSLPWNNAETSAATTFAYALLRSIGYTLLLREEQRYRAQAEELQNANEELESINWISMHDLKEPLRKIQLMASRVQGLEPGPENAPQISHVVERMAVSAGRMQRLLEGIRTYNTFRQTPMELAPVYLGDVMADVLNDLADELMDADAGVEVDGPLPGVKGQEFLLSQLFTNIIRNAVKYAREGVPPRITVSVCEQATPGEDARTTCISFADNGIGFRQEYAEEIFGLFRRLHASHEYEGTGLGLAICRKIMERHGGKMTAEGKPGEGAVFSLWFPVQG